MLHQPFSCGDPTIFRPAVKVCFEGSIETTARRPPGWYQGIQIERPKTAERGFVATDGRLHVSRTNGTPFRWWEVLAVFPKQFTVGVFNAFLVCPPCWACLFLVFGVVSHLVFHLACCVCLPDLVSQLIFQLVSELVKDALSASSLPGQFLSLCFRWQQNEKMTISIPEQIIA